MSTSSRTIDTRFVEAAIRRALLSEEEGSAILQESERTGRPASDVMVAQGLITNRTRAALTQAVQEEESARTLVQGDDKTNVEVNADDRTVATRVVDAQDPEATLASEMPERLGGYLVQDLIGQGGMGAVFRGQDENLGRTVALKVLSPDYAKDRSAADRFLREARLSARVNHPNVITVHAVGEDDGRLFMALEFLEGGDATALLERYPDGIPERRGLEIVRDCARGLVAIERAGLLHRDIKPSNIFITADGDAKLADLGLARTQIGDDRMTQTGAVVGTPCYMAPEQARGVSDLDIRTDVYALGATLFRLVTGVVPFTGSSAFVVISNVLNEPPPDPRNWRPDLSQTTADLIARAMSKDPGDRFESAAEFHRAVEDVLAEVKANGTSEQPMISGVRIGGGGKSQNRLVSQRPSTGARTQASGSGRRSAAPSRPSTQRDGEATVWPSAAGTRRPPTEPQVVLRTPTPPEPRTPLLPIALGVGALAIALLAFAKTREAPTPPERQVASAAPAPTTSPSATPQPTPQPTPSQTSPPEPSPLIIPPEPPDQPEPSPKQPPRDRPRPPSPALPPGFSAKPQHGLAVVPHKRTEEVDLGYRHDFVGVVPRPEPWAGASFTDARAGGWELPRGTGAAFEALKLQWLFRGDAMIASTKEPSWAGERGYPPNARGAFYMHLGLRANNHVLKGIEHVGKAVWLTLLFQPTGPGEIRVQGLVRVSATSHSGELAIRRNSVSRVGTLRFDYQAHQELSLTLYVSRDRWAAQVATNGKRSRPLSGTFAEAGLRRGLPRRGYVFAELGNWGDGHGLGMVRTRVTPDLIVSAQNDTLRETPVSRRSEPLAPRDGGTRRDPGGGPGPGGQRPPDGRPPPPDGRPFPPPGGHPPPGGRPPPGRHHPPPRR